jgi:hypothetical protein
MRSETDYVEKLALKLVNTAADDLNREKTAKQEDGQKQRINALDKVPKAKK